jgi:hypothetical protein
MSVAVLWPCLDYYCFIEEEKIWSCKKNQKINNESAMIKRLLRKKNRERERKKEQLKERKKERKNERTNKRNKERKIGR